MMNSMRLAGLVLMMVSVQACGVAYPAQAPSSTVASAASPWEQPAAALAEQIADALGPGQARLTIRNASTIAADEIPAIRKLLGQELKTHGVVESGAESASAIRVTLS